VQDILTLPQPDGFVRITYGSDPYNFGDLRVPTKPAMGGHPMVVNIHGGFWRARYDLTHAGHLCAALTQQGYATWNMEYRRVGNPGGGWPGSFEDLTHGFQFLQQIRYNLDLNRAIVMGHSAGGQLALVLAAHQPNLRGVISLAGVADMQRAHELKLSNDAVGEFLGGSPQHADEHFAEADPIRLPMPKMPQRLIHGTKDDIVPIELSRHYRDVKQEAGEPVKLIEIANAGHFELIDPRTEAWKTVVPAVKELER
jgi:acetyl esterase/lipase